MQARKTAYTLAGNSSVFRQYGTTRSFTVLKGSKGLGSSQPLLWHKRSLFGSTGCTPSFPHSAFSLASPFSNRWILQQQQARSYVQLHVDPTTPEKPLDLSGEKKKQINKKPNKPKKEKEVRTEEERVSAAEALLAAFKPSKPGKDTVPNFGVDQYGLTSILELCVGVDNANPKKKEIVDRVVELLIDSKKGNVKSWSNTIRPLGKLHRTDIAAKVPELMKAQNLVPNAVCYHNLIKAYGDSGQVDEALKVPDIMANIGAKGHSFTTAALVQALASNKLWDQADQLLANSPPTGNTASLAPYLTYLFFCLLHKDPERGLKLISSLNEKNLATPRLSHFEKHLNNMKSNGAS